ILYVPSEGIVGVANCWPVAVTAEIGDLHTLIDYNAPDGRYQIAQAVAFAQSLGLDLQDQLKGE
ncbi:hypothetical protein OAF54_00615, partial [bacterium]|nr:hypothetical protein [bacterium]